MKYADGMVVASEFKEDLSWNLMRWCSTRGSRRREFSENGFSRNGFALFK